MLYKYRLEIQHGCPFSTLSERHPRIEILLWCNNSQNDILELKGDGLALKKVIMDIDKRKNEFGMILKEYPEHNQLQLVMKHCECDKLPLAPIYEQYDCIELPPVKFFSGLEFVDLIVTATDAEPILKAIQTESATVRVAVLELSPLKSDSAPKPLFIPFDNLQKNLTNKQLKAITSAYNNGYYELPRSNQAKIEKLADGMEIKKRTYHEHLRKAERKIMNLVIPSLNL
ncbi:MAG: helix-turn-helix domain-containing protein [Candidatus Hodarchaeales archaeon]